VVRFEALRDPDGAWREQVAELSCQTIAGVTRSWAASVFWRSSALWSSALCECRVTYSLYAKSWEDARARRWRYSASSTEPTSATSCSRVRSTARRIGPSVFLAPFSSCWVCAELGWSTAQTILAFPAGRSKVHGTGIHFRQSQHHALPWRPRDRVPPEGGKEAAAAVDAGRSRGPGRRVRHFGSQPTRRRRVSWRRNEHQK
jgi:hypothetical protein